MSFFLIIYRDWTYTIFFYRDQLYDRVIQPVIQF